MFIVLQPIKSELKLEKITAKPQQKSQLVSNQDVTNPCCGLVVIFCGFISLLIGRKTINIQEILSGVHGFTGQTVNELSVKFLAEMYRGRKLLFDYFIISKSSIT